MKTKSIFNKKKTKNYTYVSYIYIYVCVYFFHLLPELDTILIKLQGFFANILPLLSIVFIVVFVVNRRRVVFLLLFRLRSNLHTHRKLRT